jgi:hypothetical protein
MDEYSRNEKKKKKKEIIIESWEKNIVASSCTLAFTVYGTV